MASNRSRPLTIAFLVVAVVGSIVIGSTLGHAQSTPTPSETPSTSPNTSTTTGVWTTGTENASNTPPEVDDTCAGMGVVSGRLCRGFIGALEEIAMEFLEFAQGTAEWGVEFLVSRPVPEQNGRMELVERPTNAPMDTVYDLWLTLGLPAGLLVWGLSMLLLRMSAFLPSGTVSLQRARSLQAKGWFLLFFILGSWIWCAFILHLASGLALVFAPSGEQIVASFETIMDSALAASLAGLLLWLSSGILFLFVAFVFALSWLAVYVLMPAMPVFIALSLPAVWLFRPLAAIGKRLRGLFLPCAFIPFPAAIILGVGYPVINTVVSSLDGGMSNAAGVDSFAYIVLVLVMWFSAVLSPLFLFVGSRRMRGLAALTAGALGAASGMAVASRSDRLRDRISRSSQTGPSSGVPPNAGAGHRVDPLAGSPFSRRSESGGDGGSLGQSPAGELEGGQPAGGLPQPLTANRASSEDRERWAGATQSGVSQKSAGTEFDSIPSDVTVIRVTDRSELSKDQYDAGYFNSRGQFRSLSQGPSNTGWLLDEGAFDRFTDYKPNETVVLYDRAASTVHNVEGIVNQGKYRKARYNQEHENSLRTIDETR